MDKTQLKKMLKPLIRECIKEVLFEESGVLSHVIAETLQGVSGRTVLTETKERSSTKRQPRFESDEEAKERLRGVREKLNEVVGGDYFSDVEPFQPDGLSAGGPPALMNADEGVDVEALTQLVGKGRWANSVKGSGNE